MRPQRRHHFRVYLSDETYARVVEQSEKTRIPVRQLLEAALENNTIEARDYLIYQAARNSFIATSVAIQVAAKTLSPDALKAHLERISQSFAATFGSTPPIPEEIRRRIENSDDAFVLALADLLQSQVDPSDFAGV
jgi:hypothetical protein